jgi:uncharacterized protein YjeT (DUF2065 family)
MMRRLQGFFAAIFSVNGLLMLGIPEAWFNTLPGVAATGPFNAHFVRDVGAAYLVCGLAFCWLLRDAARAWPAAVGGCLFLLFHAAIHVLEFLTGAQSLTHLLTDLPGVLLLPGVALWSAWPRAVRGGRHA